MTGLRRMALRTGVELDVQITGQAEAPALLLLHGFPESHFTWRHLVGDLACDHFVIAPDQRGYVNSSKPFGSAAYAASLIVEDVVALADALGIERFTLVGHDWGGAIAWATALRYRNRVERLVVINGPHPFTYQQAILEDPAQRVASQYISALRSASEGVDYVIGSEEAWLAKTFAADILALASPEEAAFYKCGWSAPEALHAMLHWYRASPLVVPLPADRITAPPFLGRPPSPVTLPVLVIWGVRDEILLTGQLRELHRHASALTIEKIDAGHFAPWEKPEAVLLALRLWLAEGPL